MENKAHGKGHSEKLLVLLHGKRMSRSRGRPTDYAGLHPEKRRQTSTRLLDCYTTFHGNLSWYRAILHGRRHIGESDLFWLDKQISAKLSRYNFDSPTE